MKNSSILITGCSTGIGLCAAATLKQRGYRVFASARKPEDVDKLKAKGFESLQLDMNETSSIHQALEQILKLTGGTLDAVFNNAGYMETGAIEDLDSEKIRAQFETNVFGAMELTRLVLPVMRQQGHGRIIQNSSILGIITLPFYGAYNASKFALEGFSQTLRQELSGTNIFVSIINPGPVKTQFRENAFRAYQQSQSQFQQSAHQKIYEQLENSYFNPKKPISIAVEPDAVVKQLIRALESSHPKLHYFVGFPAKSLAFLKRILPDSVLNLLLKRAQ